MEGLPSEALAKEGSAEVLDRILEAWVFTPLSLQHYLAFGAALFAIGIYGIMARRNAIGILLSLEIMLNAVNVNLVAFAHFVTPQAHRIDGQFFAIFVITVAAAEATVGLAIILALFLARGTVNADEVHLLRG